MTDEFIVAACAPRSAHGSGTLEEAEAILAAHPEVATGDICVAAILGDSAGVRRLLTEEGGRAMGPTFESALYGAAGVAHHAGLTRLLLARGADPSLGGEVASVATIRCQRGRGRSSARPRVHPEASRRDRTEVALPASAEE